MKTHNSVNVARHELAVLIAYRRMRLAAPRSRRERITNVTLRKLINAAGRIDRAERARARAEQQCAA